MQVSYIIFYSGNKIQPMLIKTSGISSRENIENPPNQNFQYPWEKTICTYFTSTSREITWIPIHLNGLNLTSNLREITLIRIHLKGLNTICWILNYRNQWSITKSVLYVPRLHLTTPCVINLTNLILKHDLFAIHCKRSLPTTINWN